MKYYDVTFQESNGRRVVKRDIPSEKEGFDVWEEACVAFDEEKIELIVNEGIYVTLFRAHLISIAAEEVENPVEARMSRRDEIMGVVNTLSKMGF